jgi:hypothetical protein
MRSRAYRRHQRARIKARHLRDYYELSPWSAAESAAAGFGPPKDIAKRHPRDCGHRCFLCHYDKLLGLPPEREIVDWRRYEDRAN